MLENIELLRLLLKKDYSGIDRHFMKYAFDVKNFTDFANQHRISGFLYKALSDSGQKNILPKKLMENFKSSYIRQWVKNQLLYKEVEFLGNLFRESGKEVIFLKGLFLAHRFFGSMFWRAIHDIDILVRERKDIDAVHCLLSRHDFKRISKIPLNTDLACYFAHHFEYRKKDIDVELHWLLQSHFTFRIDYEKIWNSKKTFIFNKKPYYVLCDEYELVAIILSIFTDLQQGKIELKSFVDVYILLKEVSKNTNWEDFFTRRRIEGLFFISLNVFDIVFDILSSYDDFKDIAAYIEKNKKHLKYKEFDKKMKLLNTSRFGIRNKSWAFSLYQTSIINSICWWAVSLPFRLMVYRNN
jgi:hypothetical protein